LNNAEEVVAEAARIEVNQETGELYIVFAVKSEKFRKYVLENWTKNIEFELKGTSLVKR
jgi:hypothetical protein